MGDAMTATCTATCTGTTSWAMTGSAGGELTLVADDGALIGVYFPHHWYRPGPRPFRPRAAPRGDGVRRRGWKLIGRIPYGQTATYGALARELAGPVLAKDVGAAVGRNTLSGIVPCHRVVGKGGKLTGYAGGLARKRFLLDLEETAAGKSGRLF